MVDHATTSPGALSARLDRLPFGGFHRRLLLIGGLGYSFDAMDVALVGLVLPVVARQWHLNGSEQGLVASSAAIGGMLGALVAGRLGDRLGRRAVMMWALAVYALASLASAAATGFGGFLLARVCAGVGTTAESVIIAPFLAEFVPARVRGRAIGALTGFFAFGYLAAAVIGWAVVPQGPLGWRVAMTISALPIAMLLWWRRSLPESPRWLASQGRFAEAEAIITGIEAQSVQDGAAMPQVHAPPATAQSPAPRAGWKALFARDLRGRTVPVLVLWAVMGLCYYAFMTWIPSLLVARGITVSKSLGFTIAIYAAQVPGYASAAWCNDRLGRRRTIAVYMAMAALAALTLVHTATAFAILCASMGLSFAINGAYGGLYAYTPEQFPTTVRATAQGLATAVSRLGAMVSPWLVGRFLADVGFSGVFSGLLAVLAFGAVVAILSGHEAMSQALD